MFYIVYKKSDKTVLFTKEDISTGWTNTPEEILAVVCSDRRVNVTDYTIEETNKLEGVRVDGSQIYDPATKTLADNPAYVPPPSVETSSIPVSVAGEEVK